MTIIKSVKGGTREDKGLLGSPTNPGKSKTAPIPGEESQMISLVYVSDPVPWPGHLTDKNVT